jgi:hypothetical protein
MKVYAFVDKRYPNLNLVVVTSDDPDLQLERVEVDVAEGESVIQAVKDKLGL